jgi:hypothetical protein
VLKLEEERFAETLENGMGVLEKRNLRRQAARRRHRVQALIRSASRWISRRISARAQRQHSLAGFEAAMGARDRRARASSSSPGCIFGRQDQFRGYGAERPGKGRGALPRKARPSMLKAGETGVVSTRRRFMPNRAVRSATAASSSDRPERSRSPTRRRSRRKPSAITERSRPGRSRSETWWRRG